MKLLITGGKGFIGRNLASYFNKKCNVYTTTRENIDLTNSQSVDLLIKKINPDCIIHCAIVGGSNVPFEMNWDHVKENLQIFYNIIKNKNYYGKLINIASGAEFDLSQSCDIMEETMIKNRLPRDSYGLSKNIISNTVLTLPNSHNIRLFGCFGKDENSSRLFKRFLYDDKFTLYDRQMDFISINDLCRIVDHFVFQNVDVKDCNAVYQKKMTIFKLLKLFSEIHNIDKHIEDSFKYNYPYTGSSIVLSSLDLKLEGLEEGIKNYI